MVECVVSWSDRNSHVNLSHTLGWLDGWKNVVAWQDSLPRESLLIFSRMAGWLNGCCWLKVAEITPTWISSNLKMVEWLSGYCWFFRNIQENLLPFSQGWLDGWMVVVGCSRNHSSESLHIFSRLVKWFNGCWLKWQESLARESLHILGWLGDWMVAVAWNGGITSTWINSTNHLLSLALPTALRNRLIWEKTSKEVSLVSPLFLSGY